MYAAEIDILFANFVERVVPDWRQIWRRGENG